jgi:hypothetical protein
MVGYPVLDLGCDERKPTVRIALTNNSDRSQTIRKSPADVMAATSP